MKLLVASLFCCWVPMIAPRPAPAVGHEFWILDGAAGAREDVWSHDLAANFYETLPSSRVMDRGVNGPP